MSMNILNDISKVYLEQVVDEGKSLDEAGGRHGGGSMVGKPGGPPPRTQGPQNPEDSVYSDEYREKQKNRNKARFGPKSPVEEALQTPKRWWDDDGDGVGYENGEVSGKFKKKKKKKTRVKKESFSDWRDDLSELVEVIDSKKIKEKKKVGGKIEEGEVDNKELIKINPKLGGSLGEAVEELGGTLLEMVEIEDVDCIFDDLSESEVFLLSDNLIEEVVEEFFFECIQEGYGVEEIENVLVESIEISSALLTEADDIKSNRLEKVKSAVKKVGKGLARGAGYVAGAAVRGVRAVGREFSKGYDRGRGGSSGGDSSQTSSPQASSPQSDTKETGSKRPGLLGRIGSALKSGLKRAVGAGARAVSRGARNVARRMGNVGNGDDKPSTTSTAQRKPSTYRGAGAGKTERVSSGSYTPPTQKKTKPAQPVSDPWKGSETTPKRRMSKSEKDDLLNSIRNESKAELDEKMNLKKAEMGTVIKDFYKSDAPQFKGRTKEERRKMAVAAILTAERGGLKLGEQMVDEPVAPAPDPAIDKNKQNLDKQKIANMKMLQQKQQTLQRQRLQMQKSGKLPLDVN